MFSEFAGSSPRVRGTPDGLAGRVALPRFIPACAGNAASPAASAARASVHPRVCGERGAIYWLPRDSAGSSPRVRGTLRRGRRPGTRLRFIPACAGNACSGTGCSPNSPVHPRVCGERRTVSRAASRSHGSSPRVRGTPRHPRPRRHAHRFIPACAGNAGRSTGCRATPPVHPRVCGERYGEDAAQELDCGSSPRVRGTRVDLQLGIVLDRFIPACAGNACAAAGGPGPASVHPRVCGERAGPRTSTRAARGSSPRVRGTRRHDPPAALRRRFIPACAGNATARGASGAGRPVHPRVCGERVVGVRFDCAGLGSSPRVRGTLLQQELGTKHVSQCQRAYQMFLLSSDR